MLVEVPPLQPLTRSSIIVTPRPSRSPPSATPWSGRAENLTGKRDNPVLAIAVRCRIGWDVTRGPLAVTGRPEALSVSTALNGTLRATGQFANKAGDLSGVIGNLLNQNLGQNARG